MAALEKKAAVSNFYNSVPVYFQLIQNILSFIYIYGTVSKLGDYVIHFFPQSLSYFLLNLQHPLPVLWEAGQVLAAVSQDKKNAVSFLIETFKVRSWSYLLITQRL